MIKYSPCFILLLFFYSCSVTQKHYDPNKKYPTQQLKKDYAILENILEKKHPSLYWYTGKDSMDYYFSHYHSAIEDSMTEQQFGWKIIAPLLQKIHCGHTSFMMSDAYNKWVIGKAYPSIPLLARVWKDTIVITANLNRQDSVLKKGYFITAINGIPNATLIKTCFNFMSQDGYDNSVNYQRLSANFPYFHRNIFGLSKNYTIDYIDASGIKKTSTVPMFSFKKDSNQKTVNLPKIKPQKKLTKFVRLQSMRSIAIDTASSAAYITLNTFNNGKLRKFFRQSFKYIRKTNINNVVIDIRNNGGGKINYSTLLTKYVINHPFKIADSTIAVAKTLHPFSKYIDKSLFYNLGLYFSTKRKKDGQYHFRWWERKTYHPKTKNHFGGHIYVLINGQTFSAAALFSKAVKGQENITLIGEETGGGAYGNNGILIPEIILPNTHLHVRLPLFRLVQYKHGLKDGRGIMPDIYIETSYDAIMNSYDKKLKLVGEMIQKKNHK